MTSKKTPVSKVASSTSEKGTYSRKQKHQNLGSALRWFLLFVAITSSVVVAVMLNQAYENNTSSKLADSIRVDKEDEEINWDNYPTSHIELSGSIDIVDSGTFHLTGTLEDGMININNPRGQVRLILDNVTIKHSSGPAILCQAAKNLVIDTVGENYLVDGKTYSDLPIDEVDGVIFSMSDLSFQGDGRLTIKANYQDGIVSKDDIKFDSGTYIVTSMDDGIRGKDSVYITGGEYIINSGADAIKSTNQTDIDKGFILVEEGSFNLTASAKGLSATKTILLSKGRFIIDAYDDAVHSNNHIGIQNVVMNINSSDDAIHTDYDLIIDGGDITIVKALEGLEAQTITINNGKLNITSLDDGINITSEEVVEPRQFDTGNKSNQILTVNGGSVYIDAAGDGIDSNGWIYINGGNIAIDGPTNNNNGALDATMGIIMNGGQVIAIGSSGMAGTLGNASGVYNVSIYLDSTYPEGTKIAIQNEAGDTIMEHLSAKDFSHIAAGSPKLNFGEKYRLLLNGVEYRKFLISNITTVVGVRNQFEESLETFPR